MKTTSCKFGRSAGVSPALRVRTSKAAETPVLGFVARCSTQDLSSGTGFQPVRWDAPASGRLGSRKCPPPDRRDASPTTKHLQLSTFNLQLLLALLLLATFPLHAATTTTDFDQANKLYEEGKFGAAAEAYAKMVSTGNSSSAVLFNQGNAHFKAGQIGQAIAAYRRAGQLTPRDPDLRANLEFARQRVTGPTLHPGPVRRATDSLSTNEWTLLALAPVWLWFALMIAGQVRPALRPRLRSALIGSGVIALLCCGALGWILNGRYNEPQVVVTTREAVARFGPLAESQSAFTATDGAELRVLDAKDDWFQVSDGAKSSGWVKSNAVARVGN